MLESRARTLRTQRLLGDGDREVFLDGAAPCVVAVHGFTGTASELKPVLDAIGAAGHGVEARLLPGHGTLPTALQGETFDHWCAAARASFERARARYGRVVLLGFSMGSLVALRLASERPEGLAGLVVLGNAVRLARYASLPYAAFARFGWPIPDAYLVKPTPADALDREAARHVVTYDRHPLRAAFEVYRAGERVRGDVARIDCPTFIGHGAHDHVCPVDNAAWLAAHLGTKDVTVRIYANSAHMIGIDFDRDAVARDVVAFVRARG